MLCTPVELTCAAKTDEPGTLPIMLTSCLLYKSVSSACPSLLTCYFLNHFFFFLLFLDFRYYGTVFLLMITIFILNMIYKHTVCFTLFFFYLFHFFHSIHLFFLLDLLLISCLYFFIFLWLTQHLDQLVTNLTSLRSQARHKPPQMLYLYT